MRFAQPGFFYLLFIIPVCWLFFWFDYSRRLKIINLLFSKRAQKQIVNLAGPKKQVLKLILFSLFLGMLITALARPQWGEKIELLPQRNLNAYFLLDTSSSMLAEDIYPSRFQAAQRLAGLIAESLKPDQIALVNFAATAYLQCPLTFDREAFKIMLEVSSISPSSEQGTDFTKLLEFCLQLIEVDSEAVNLFILLSDGEDHSNRWQKIAAEFKKRNLPVFSVGIGKSSPAKIPLRNTAGVVTGFKKDSQGAEVETALQSLNLKMISDLSGGSYFYFDSDNQILKISAGIKKIVSQKINQKFRKVPVERYSFPLVLAVIFLTAYLFSGEVRK